MNDLEQEIGYKALLSAAKAMSSNIPETLLLQAYQIQTNRQFEKDREIPLREIQKLVEDYVSSQSQKHSK